MQAIHSLKTIQLDALRETANIGAGHAATALSQMTGSTIMIKVPSISVASMTTRFVGMPGDAVADVRCLALQPRDWLLLCSDGLTEMLEDDKVQAILRQSASPEEACARLVAAANDSGGRDNITVVIVEGGPA